MKITVTLKDGTSATIEIEEIPNASQEYVRQWLNQGAAAARPLAYCLMQGTQPQLWGTWDYKPRDPE